MAWDAQNLAGKVAALVAMAHLCALCEADPNGRG
jgi:hypothetical protein